MVIDVHCHYTLSRRLAGDIPRFSFEPRCDYAGNVEFDSCVSPRVLRKSAWRLTRWCLGLNRLEPGPALDQQVELLYRRHLMADGPVDRFVLLAFDWYHDRHGQRMALPETNDEVGSDIYSSNSFIRQLCRENPERFLLGASVHPYRERAIECIDEVFAAGAVLLKWLPLHQNIDITDPRTVRVLRHCAEIGLPILVHYNEEFTLATNHPEWQGVGPALEILRRLHRQGCMPVTIMAHAATPVTSLGDRVPFEQLKASILGEFRHAPLFADISALGTWGKVGFLRDLARHPELHAKLMFGSDFPVPLGTRRLKRELGGDYPRIRAIESWPQRYARICQYVGMNEIVMEQAADVLPNIPKLVTD